MDISSARLKHTEWRSAVLPGDAGEKRTRKTKHHGVGLTRMYEHVTKSRISVLPKEKYRKCPVGGDHSLLPYRAREMHTESGSRQLNLAGLAAR